MPKERISPRRTSASLRSLTRGGVNNWLFKRRRTILREIEKVGRIQAWAHFVSLMEADGVTRPSGKPLTVESVRNAWREIAAEIEREAKVKMAAPPKAPRPVVNWRTPNVEPPSRLPPPDTGIRFPTALTREPPGFRERYPETYGAPASPTPSPPASTQGALIHPEMTPEAAERLAAVISEMEALDGFQPISRKRGRII